jgi:hypothetical protein
MIFCSFSKLHLQNQISVISFFPIRWNQLTKKQKQQSNINYLTEGPIELSKMSSSDFKSTERKKESLRLRHLNVAFSKLEEKT